MPFFNAESVDPAAHKMYSLEGDSIDYDLLIAVPPHRGTNVIKNSGFGDEDGWIPADKGTMRVKGHDDAFAIGDATAIAESFEIRGRRPPSVPCRDREHHPRTRRFFGIHAVQRQDKLPDGGRKPQRDVRLGDVHIPAYRSEPLDGQVLYEEVFLQDVLEDDEGEHGMAHGDLLRQDQLLPLLSYWGRASPKWLR